MGSKVLLTVKELLNATNGSLFDENCESLDSGFVFVTTDSRNVVENSLFIPLIGENQDGHQYVENACNRGSSIVLVQDSSTESYKEVYAKLVENNKVIIVVKNTLRALQETAKFYVSKFSNLKKIAITGSNGKTTAKECVGAVLSQKYNVIMNVGNLNSETGLPLSMFTISEEHEIGVFEMGTNRKGEIKELADVFFPDIALITNIGTAHIGILGTQDAIAEEKKQIFSNFNRESIGFVFEDDDYVDFLTKNSKGSIHTYGTQTTDGIGAIRLNGILGSDIQYKNTIIHYPLVGKHNSENAIAAICIAQYFDLSEQEIKQGLESIKPLFGRSEILHGNPTIIQDCYNGSFESTSASIDFFVGLTWEGNKTIFLGDMLELGEKSAIMHESIISKVINSTVDTIVLIGENFSNAYLNFTENHTKKVLYSKTIDDKSVELICENVKEHVSKTDILLFKGSRGIKLERASNSFKDMYKTKEAV